MSRLGVSYWLLLAVMSLSSGLAESKSLVRYTEKVSWMRAGQLCQDHGQRLLVVDSYTEFCLRHHALTEPDHYSEPFWIGMYKDALKDTDEGRCVSLSKPSLQRAIYNCNNNLAFVCEAVDDSQAGTAVCDTATCPVFHQTLSCLWDVGLSVSQMETSCEDKCQNSLGCWGYIQGHFTALNQSFQHDPTASMCTMLKSNAPISTCRPIKTSYNIILKVCYRYIIEIDKSEDVPAIAESCIDSQCSGNLRPGLDNSHERDPLENEKITSSDRKTPTTHPSSKPTVETKSDTEEMDITELTIPQESEVPEMMQKTKPVLNTQSDTLTDTQSMTSSHTAIKRKMTDHLTAVTTPDYITTDRPHPTFASEIVKSTAPLANVDTKQQTAQMNSVHTTISADRTTRKGTTLAFALLYTASIFNRMVAETSTASLDDFQNTSDAHTDDRTITHMTPNQQSDDIYNFKVADDSLLSFSKKDSTSVNDILTTMTVEGRSSNMLNQSILYKTNTPQITNAITQKHQCPCECRIILPKQKQQNIAEDIKTIQHSLRVNSTNLSAKRRRKQSAEDPRPSAQYAGAVSILILIAGALAIVLPDLRNVIAKAGHTLREYYDRGN